MKCLQAEENFSAHFEDMLDYNTLQLFESHLDECSVCQQEYAQFCETIQVSQKLPQVEPSPFFLTTLNNKLLVETHETLSFWERINQLFRMPRWALSGAMVLLFVAASVMFVYQDDIFNQENQSLNPNRPSITSQKQPANQNQSSTTKSQSMQQHYTLKRVSYTVDAIGGGL